MVRSSFLLGALAAASLLAAACGGNVVVDAPTGGTGGATTIPTGAGGASTSTSSSSGQASCGGKAGLTCGADEWCQFPPSAECGSFDEQGTCQPKPGGCTADCPGVCGCDGKFYCNECVAHQSGVDVGGCTGGG
jgi:hypothetical protein